MLVPALLFAVNFIFFFAETSKKFHRKINDKQMSAALLLIEEKIYNSLAVLYNLSGSRRMVNCLIIFCDEEKLCGMETAAQINEKMDLFLQNPRTLKFQLYNP